MKKIILLAIAFCFIYTAAMAAPFLVCDDPPAEEQVTGYECFQDGVSRGTTPAPLHLDLEGVTPGAYNFTCTAINIWGASSPSNPYVSPAESNIPVGLRLEP